MLAIATIAITLIVVGGIAHDTLEHLDQVDRETRRQQLRDELAPLNDGSWGAYWAERHTGSRWSAA